VRGDTGGEGAIVVILIIEERVNSIRHADQKMKKIMQM
jgi:hypothetical protein